MLVQAGADINAKTKNGETPYGKALFLYLINAINYKYFIFKIM